MTRGPIFFFIATLLSVALFAGITSSVPQRLSVAQVPAEAKAVIVRLIANAPAAGKLRLLPSLTTAAKQHPPVAAARTYLPASALTERPVVLQDIDTELLPALWPVAPQTLVFQLLINEYGDVDQVLVEKSSLPQGLLAELRQRFLAARFAPGRLHGRAVATALRIAVQLQ